MSALFGGSSRGRGAGPVLTGKRVYLRPPSRRDSEAWIALRRASRSFLEPWEPSWSEDSLTKAGFRRRLRRQIREANEDLGYSFLVFRLGDNQLLGGVSLSGVQRGVSQSCSLGYWIGETFARQGYMSDALRTLLPYCFGAFGLHRVEAACLPANESSRALLEKCGFRREGYVHEFLKINGRWRDHLLYGLLAQDLGAAD